MEFNFNLPPQKEPQEPAPPVGDDVFGDPEIKALQDEIAEIVESIELIAPAMKSLSDEAKKVKDEREHFIQEARKAIAKFSSRLMDMERERRKVEQQMRDAEERKARLLADISHRVEAMEAFAQLEDARKRWQDIIDEHDWLWAHAAREYQMVAVQFIASGLDRGLFGVGELDQMGLGKTLIARGGIDLIQHHPKFPELLSKHLEGWTPDAPWTSATLWVCPDSIKGTTAVELRKWSTAPALVLEGGPEKRKLLVEMAHQTGLTLIVGYAQLRDRGEGSVTPQLFEHEWPIMVADEIHAAKNRNSSTFINVERLAKRAGYFVPMTGTPIENRAAEFWTVLHLLTLKGKRAYEFDSFPRFERMYLGTYDGRFRYGQFDELMNTVADMVIRRTKAEVQPELPAKVKELRLVQMRGKQRELYDQMRERLFIWLDQEAGEYISGSNFLAQLTRLRQIALYPRGVKIQTVDGDDITLDCDESAKIDDAMNRIRELMSNDAKVLIFSCFKEPLYRLQELIEQERMTWVDQDGNECPVRSAAITGDVDPRNRPLIQENFNDPQSDVRVVVGTIKAMGLGLNLQHACSNCIFLDLFWNPSSNEQAEDRLHRMGQGDNVQIDIIQAESSVDAFIAQILDEKKGVFNDMFERQALRKALEDGLI